MGFDKWKVRFVPASAGCIFHVTSGFALSEQAHITVGQSGVFGVMFSLYIIVCIYLQCLHWQYMYSTHHDDIIAGVCND